MLGVPQMSDWNEKQVDTWHQLLDRATNVLARHGTEYHSGMGDYSVIEDNYGWRRITVGIHNLNLLMPEVVGELKSLLIELPDWEIVLGVDIVSQANEWPVMGLTIRQHEIIDGLQRQYFPAEYRNLTYEDGRPGTGYD